MLNRFSKLATVTIDKPVFEPTKLESSTTTDAEAKQALLAVRARGGNSALVDALTGLPAETQLKLLSLMVPSAPVNFAGSVLDSGSSKHLSAKTCVTHEDDRLSLQGFNDSAPTAWTQGNGYLPVSLVDKHSSCKVDFDIQDADKLDTVACDILSLGKLVRAGFQFYFESPSDMFAVFGSSKFPVEL